MIAEVPIFPRYPSVAHGLAYLMARRAIEHQWRAQGLRIRRYADIIEQARDYLAEHQEELLARAAERVQRNPKLRKMVELEERDREREWRKSVRKGVVENPTGRSVSGTGSAKSGTENAR
jgi:hypothetical protein